MRVRMRVRNLISTFPSRPLLLKSPRMIRVCRWILIATTLLASVRTLLAASNAEDRKFTGAMTTFQAGFFEQAAQEFADFGKRYPNSPRLPEAVLYEGKARFYRGQ